MKSEIVSEIEIPAERVVKFEVKYQVKLTYTICRKNHEMLSEIT